MPEWGKDRRKDGADERMTSGDGEPGPDIIKFGEFRIDPARRRLARGGYPGAHRELCDRADFCSDL